jgi:hypothetical protein
MNQERTERPKPDDNPAPDEMSHESKDAKKRSDPETPNDGRDVVWASGVRRLLALEAQGGLVEDWNRRAGESSE